MECESKRLRVYDELPVIICEWHQHVLPHIHRGIASRHLPASGLKILHFDAHPDLTFPVNMLAADCFNKDILYDQIEIADWILPLCYEGHVNKVTWVKPQWADQIADSEVCVKVGEGKATGGLRVNWKEDYFIEELLYAKDDNLINAKEVQIKVETLHSELDSAQKFPIDHARDSSLLDDNTDDGDEEVQPQEQKLPSSPTNSSKIDLIDGKFLLDIDLDFFSTYNPFKLHHSEDDFAKLSELYTFLSPTHYSEEQVAEATTQRYRQLMTLQKTILYFMQTENLPNMHENIEYLNLIDDITLEVKESEISRSFYDLLQCMKEKQKEEGKDIDLDLVHFAGMSSELPHHRSTSDEIKASLRNMENFLLKHPVPQIITISRSTEDDYTPSDQVAYIQTSVINMLTRLYGKISITTDYEELTTHCS